MRNNTAILAACPESLVGFERYYRPFIAAALEPLPCPVCGRHVSQVDAIASIQGDLDRFSPIYPAHRNECRCPGCQTPLVRLYSLTAGCPGSWEPDTWGHR